MIGIVAKLRVQPDKISVYERTFKELIAMVRAREPGTVFYEQFKRPEEPNTYTIIEVYKDKIAQTSHAETDYYKSAIPEILTCIDGEIDINFYESL